MLTPEELSELDELLAGLPEEFEPMDAPTLDGFLCSVALCPKRPPLAEWMPYVTDAAGHRVPDGTPGIERIHQLASARYRDMQGAIESGGEIDPLVFDPEDGDGNPIEGPESAVALQPFAIGFLEAMDRWPGLSDTDSPDAMAAMIGILRHLPPEQQGDLAGVIEGLDRDNPIGDLDEALADVISCVGELAALRPKKRPGTHRRHH